jgi:transposase InsO family protein
MIAEPGHNYAVVRKVGRTLSISCIPLIRQCISDWNLWPLFTENKSIQTVTCTVNGNQIKFLGLDDIEKVKSITFDRGSLTDILIKEATEITEQDFNQLNLRLRGQSKVPFQITLLFNPVSDTYWMKCRFFDNPGEKRRRIAGEVERLHLKTGIGVLTLVGYAGVSQRTWQEWQDRSGQETRHNGHIPREHWVTPEEEAAIIAYCRDRMGQGYRVLCWEMVDANIAAVSPATVYNVQKRNGMTKKWAETKEGEKKGFEQPKAVHEQWHMDFSYIRIGGIFFFVSILDGYSRKILAWNLCENMKGINAETLLMRAKELYPQADPRIITDNGSQFISHDFKELVVLLEFEQTFITAGHPQSNGKLERFHRTFKTEHVRREAYLGYEDAVGRMAKWIRYYNEDRLHSAIFYLAPEDVFEGHMAERLAIRREKLHTALINRRSFWQNQAAKL